MSSLGSSAASFSNLRACARHADMLGPRFCTDCGTSLCAACARHKPHRRCPSCNEQAGEKASRIDATWFAHLFVDSLLLAWRTARARVFGIVMATGLLATVGIVYAVGAVDMTSEEDSDLLTFLALPSLALLLGMLVAPALELPLATPVPLARRMARALLGAVLPLTVVSALAAGPGWLAFELIDSDSAGLMIVGMILLVFGSMLGGALLLSFLYPIQAFVAVRGDSPLRAFGRPFGAGIGAIALMLAAHTVLSFGSLSAIDTISNVVTLAALASPWFGLLLGWPLCVAAGAVVLFGMGAYGAATLRYVEDRKRLR
jgi:hypothetical protein